MSGKGLPEEGGDVLGLLRKISGQVAGVEEKIDANARAMGSLTAKLDRLETVVEQLEHDVRGGKRRVLAVSAITSATVSLLVAVCWELIKARVNL